MSVDYEEDFLQKITNVHWNTEPIDIVVWNWKEIGPFSFVVATTPGYPTLTELNEEPEVLDVVEGRDTNYFWARVIGNSVAVHSGRPPPINPKRTYGGPSSCERTITENPPTYNDEEPLREHGANVHIVIRNGNGDEIADIPTIENQGRSELYPTTDDGPIPSGQAWFSNITGPSKYGP